jgi:hypothetical protein
MKRLFTLTIAFVAVCSLLWACKSPQTIGPPQIITICKQTIPAGGTGFPFTWIQGSSGAPVAWATLNDTQCQTVNVANQDHYNRFTENIPPGWTLTNISCNNTTTPVKFIGADADPAFQPGDNTVMLDLNEASVTCTFVNQLPACCGYTFDLSTGQGNGQTDSLWSMNNGNAYITPAAPGWIGLPPAQWIQSVASPTPNYNPNPVNITYSYRATFDVPDCNLGHVELNGTFAADNSATAFLDGVAIPGATCAGPICFNSPQAPVTLNVSSIPPGPHILQIDVTDEGGYSGLIVNAQLRRICP